MFAKDGVHLQNVGTKCVATNIEQTLTKLANGTLGKKATNTPSSAVSITGTDRHQWRGFVSPYGSVKRQRDYTGWCKAVKRRPYAGRDGHGGQGGHGGRMESPYASKKPFLSRNRN
jgi:hypothetical protein